MRACRTAWILSCVACVICLVPSALARSSAVRGVTVWLPYWSMSAALGSTLGNADLIGTASPDWYTIAGSSRVQPNSGTGDTSVISQLHARGIQVVPMVTESDGMLAFGRVLASPAHRASLVRALISIASNPGYAGLDLDFEQMALDPRHNRGPADQIAAQYPAFVAQACAALHAIHRSCQVTAMPRTTSAHVYWRGRLATWVYDYGALGRAADRLQVMAYDDHSTVSGAVGPVAPLPWVGQVIAYTRSQTPLDRVELGLAAYGYDWSSAGEGTSLTARQAAQLAVQVGARVRWSARQGEDSFTYTQSGSRHTVWFENATADGDRAAMAAADGFAGVAIWAAGDEDPGVWSLLRGLRRD
jgi:spore germination protein YaaH